MRRMGKIIRGICAVLAVLMISVCLTGCGEEMIAGAVVESNLTALKNLDIEATKENIDLDRMVIVKLAGVKAEDYLKYMKNIFSGIEYNIMSVDKVNSKKVLVRTQISNYNMKPAIEEWTTKSVNFIHSNVSKIADMSDAELNQKFMQTLDECTKNVNTERITKEFDIVVIKEGGVWKIDIDRELLDSIYGGAIDAFETMGLTINGMF